MQPRPFGQAHKAALLDAIKECREGTVLALRTLEPESDEYKACSKLVSAIDDVAGMLITPRHEV